MFENLMGQPIDYIILVVYFGGILAFGAYFARFSKSTSDFFFGGQRFSWWLIAASLVATGIGSYSFLKYAQTGFMSGMSSTMSYLNDWLIIPLFMFGWLPIIYYMRIKSVPEFFERRFDTKTRNVATFFVLIYLLGYIGLNFYLMGLALEALLGIPMWLGIGVVAFISAIYVTTGGQTAVIFTDLVQGLFLYIAGAILLYLGITHVMGWGNWWHGMDLAHRLPFPGFHTPAEFSYSGMFWGEGIIGSMAFTFINQGFIMRYLAVKSVNEGRKTLTFNTLILMPISAVVVGSIGWVAVAMATRGEISTNVNSKDVFMLVSNMIARPGIFGFVIAALTAALMSTIDTLINATAAIGVFDIYKPLIAPNRDDHHYLKASRVISILATIIGLVLVPIFANTRSILAIHYGFVAAITPPMLVVILLGILWKRFSPNAAFWSMILGGLAIAVSIFFPQMIIPLSNTHGLSDGTTAEVVFEAWEDGPIMGPRSAYNWGEVFEKDDEGVTQSKYLVEYWVKGGENPEKNRAPLYTKDEVVGGKTMHRFAARLEGLEPRSKYAFHIIEPAGLLKFNVVATIDDDDEELAAWREGRVADKALVPHNIAEMTPLAFQSDSGNIVLSWTMGADGVPSEPGINPEPVPEGATPADMKVVLEKGMASSAVVKADIEGQTLYFAEFENLPEGEFKYEIHQVVPELVYDAIGNYGVDKETKAPVDILGQKSHMVPHRKLGGLGFATGGDYKYFRAVFGILACLFFALILTPFTKPKKDIDGLTLTTIFKGKEFFKGSKPNEKEVGERITRPMVVIDGDEEWVYLDPEDMEKTKAKEGDLLYVADRRKWLGGLRSVHVNLGTGKAEKGKVVLTKAAFENGNFLPDKGVYVEKII